MRAIRSSCHWWLGLVLLLFLIACGANGEGEQPSVVTTEPVAVAATAESTPEPPPTALPTLATVVPTVTPTLTPTPTPPAPLAAVVNGQYVFLADYEERVAQYEQALVEMGVDLGSPDGQAQLIQGRQDVLEGLIDDILIGQGGVALGVQVSEAELLAQAEADIAAGGGQDAFDQWLASTGQTREDYLEMLRQSLTAQGVWEAVVADVPQADEQVHAQVIEVSSVEEAQQVLAELQAGGDFAALAQEWSLDQATKDNGGDMGWFPRRVFAAELDEVAFALQPGQIGEPVAVDESVYVVRVVEREAARPLALELLLHLQQLRFDDWMEELRAKAVIERFVGE